MQRRETLLSTIYIHTNNRKEKRFKIIIINQYTLNVSNGVVIAVVFHNLISPVVEADIKVGNEISPLIFKQITAPVCPFVISVFIIGFVPFLISQIIISPSLLPA